MLLSETFCDDATFTMGIYFWEEGKLVAEDYEYDDTIEIRLYHRYYSAANGYTVKFQTEIDVPIIVGDVLYDSINDEYYICTESYNIDTIHYQGKLTLCNWILKWQDKTGKIFQYPCYDINSTQYNSGETSNKQFTVGTAQHLITLPYDENTILLSTPQRFFLDKNKVHPTSFIVSQNDNTSYNIGKKGIVRLTVMQCETNNDKDNFELGICDYIEPDEDSAIDTTVTINSVIHYNTKIIKSGGDMQKFVGRFYDSENDELTGFVPKWNIICDFKSELEVEESGNEIRIGIDNEDYIDEDFKLVFSDENDLYTSTLLVTIDSLL